MILRIFLLTLRADIIQNDGPDDIRCHTTSWVFIRAIDKCVTDAYSLFLEDVLILYIIYIYMLIYVTRTCACRT